MKGLSCLKCFNSHQGVPSIMTLPMCNVGHGHRCKLASTAPTSTANGLVVANCNHSQVCCHHPAQVQSDDAPETQSPCHAVHWPVKIKFKPAHWWCQAGHQFHSWRAQECFSNNLPWIEWPLLKYVWTSVMPEHCNWYNACPWVCRPEPRRYSLPYVKPWGMEPQEEKEEKLKKHYDHATKFSLLGPYISEKCLD